MASQLIKGVCYFCGGPATSREHAPPKQMFAVADCDSITVPSCDRHNSRKSSIDQAVVAAFLTPLRSYIAASAKLMHPIPPIVREAIDRAGPSFERAKRRAIPSVLLKTPPPDLGSQPEIAYLVPEVNLRSWVVQLTAALTYDATGGFDPSIDWAFALAWSPAWLSAPAPDPMGFEYVRSRFEAADKLRLQLEALPWNPGWSAQPRPYPREIYCFDLAVVFETSFAMRHVFYNQFAWYAWYVASPASESTIAVIKQRIGSAPSAGSALAGYQLAAADPASVREV